eukprot:CAMPEP_0168752406 /NCGR_PEP_ID=MMETSP0724-20121128/18368_1 /TAXON_ID=265536 /ORGANISM="Amphiprora sp., Strain CCMP467" /LENGTH=81 /DNA_ID=CAMNT_0008800651 /DNA_START=298 /DNA_END=543 /DNA_ORIENTATION=+
MVRIDPLRWNNKCLWTNNANGWGNAVMGVVSGALRLARTLKRTKFNCLVSWTASLQEFFPSYLSIYHSAHGIHNDTMRTNV